MNRILLEPHELRADGTASLTDERAQHIRTVLHGTAGQSLKIGLLNGPRGTGTITSLTNHSVELTCTLEAAAPAVPRVDLLLALPRPKVMRRLWAPLATLGVGTVIITNAAKVERNYFDAHALQERTFRPLLVEGLQQAGDTRLPNVHIRRRLKVLVEDELDALCPTDHRVLADPSGPTRLSHLVVPPSSRVLLAVGPEGGWTPYELQLLGAHGFTIVSAGERILRTDTACVALLAILHERMG